MDDNAVLALRTTQHARKYVCPRLFTLFVPARSPSPLPAQTIKAHKGPTRQMPSRGDTIRVNYVGVVKSTGKEFDRNVMG